VLRFSSLIILFASAAMAAPSESAAFCPLTIEPNPSLTDAPEALQKKFLAVAREKSGYNLALRSEVDAALAKANAKDLSSDAQLAKVATLASAKNAGAFAFRITQSGDLLLEGRVVSAEGKLLKSAMVSVPRNGEPVLDALTRAATRFFDALHGVLAENPHPLPVASTPPPNPNAAPPMAPPLVFVPVEPPNPGTPLRIAGGIIGAGGIATTVVGVVLFATAGSVTKDQFGNIADSEVGKVREIREKQGAALGALTAGVALTLTGTLMFALAPNAPVTAGVAPTNDGALFAVGGTF
jgi:hypothetical protein